MRVSRRSKCSATWLTSADRERCKLLKIAGSCAIICLLDGASPRSPREDAEASRRRLGCRNDPLGHAQVATLCGCCASVLSGCKGSWRCCSLARRPQRRRLPLDDRRGHRPPDGPRHFRASGALRGQPVGRGRICYESIAKLFASSLPSCRFGRGSGNRRRRGDNARSCGRRGEHASATPDGDSSADSAQATAA